MRGTRNQLNAMKAKKPDEKEDAKSMFVAVRIRPLSEKEQESHHRACTEVLDGKVVAIKKSGNAAEYLKSQSGSIHEYGFDAAFDEAASQYDVYSKTTKPFLDYLLDGINVTVFAYGATGAGKTHTLMGNARCDAASAHADAGIIPNAICDLFKLIERKRKTAAVGEKFSLVMNYIEVYNEQVYDLIDGTTNRKSLRVCEDQDKGIVAVQGATDKIVDTAEEVLDLLQQGNKNRSTEATMANSVSSRSHAVLQVYVKSSISSATRGRDSYTEAKLSLIDLAGSERASATNNRGVRLQEGANINKSLLALANCINALAAEKKTNVKYRDSKLTHLLKSSLEGNCKLVMIANINPSHITFEDSHNTLKYANRAKNIKLNPTATEHAKNDSWLERETRLRNENTELRQKVDFLETLVAQLRQDLDNGGVSSSDSTTTAASAIAITTAAHEEEEVEVIRAHSPTKVRELKQARINKLRRRSSAIIPTEDEVGYEETKAKVRKNRASMCAEVLTSLLTLPGANLPGSADKLSEEQCWKGTAAAEEEKVESAAANKPSKLKLDASASSIAFTGGPVSPRAGRKLPGQTPSKIPCTGRKRRLAEVDEQTQGSSHQPMHSRSCSEECEDQEQDLEQEQEGASSVTGAALGGASSPWKNMFSDTMLADGLFGVGSNPPSAAGSKLPVSRKKQPRQQQTPVSPTPYGGEGSSGRRESVKRIKIEEVDLEVEQEEQQPMVAVGGLTPAKSPVPTHSSTENNANFTRSPLGDITYSSYKSAPQSPTPDADAATESVQQEPANLVLHAGEVNPFAFIDKSPTNPLDGTIKDLILMPNAVQYGATEAPLQLFSPGMKETAKPVHKKRRGSLLPMPRGRAKVAMEEEDEDEGSSPQQPIATRRSSRLSTGNPRIKPVANVIPGGSTASSRRKSVAPSTSATCKVNDENMVNGNGKQSSATTGGIMAKVQNMTQRVAGH